MTTTCLTMNDTAPATTASRSTSVANEWKGGVIDGHRVHPLANEFPLIGGEEFDELVASIEAIGIATPVEFHDGMLIDGRNRLRAVEVLRERGLNIDVPHIDWVPRDDESVEEHIYAINVVRRHLTDDQRAVLATKLLPTIRNAASERRAKSRFQKGLPTVARKSELPVDWSEPKPRDPKAKFEASTVGQLASIARISPTKASQAIALADGLERNEIAPEVMDSVIRGETPLRDAVPKKTKKPATATAKTRRPEPTPLAGGDLEPTEPVVREKWERMKASFAVSDHRELRRVLAQIIREEQAHFDHVK